YVLIALGLEGMQPRAFSIAVAFNIITNLIFIPRFSFVAAGVTTVLSEVVLMVMFAYYLKKKMPGVNWLHLLAKPLALTAVVILIMALITYLTHPVIGVAAGLLLYGVGLIALRILGGEERTVLRAILPAPLTAKLRI
ncbi:MAG: polysaccharide biosynthesis C-terminal domain-containing protein, partial [Anaerolineae bacterium]|nr:polysaccharide biosynthesis C-terminal domain-containing protein [Anaerolineae bacterium]